jgi:hypothetical protein
MCSEIQLVQILHKFANMKNSKVVYFFTGVYRLICPVVALFATTAAKQQARNT